jgi:hypothetical protein
VTRRLALVVLAALALAPLADAAPGPVFGMRGLGNPKRGYFVYALSPGAVQHGSVIVSNTGNRAGVVKLFASDATTGRTSGTVYLTDRAPAFAGKWITLSSSAVPLKPGAHKVVPFTVHVPAGAPAGQWVAGIVAETSHQVQGQKSKRKASVQIRIRDLTIIAVQVNVPGPPVTSFAIGKVTTGGQRGYQQVIVHLANTGNQLAKPTGTVTIFDSNGKLVQVLDFTMDTFLPRTAIDYPVLLKKALGPGSYTATVSLHAPGAKTVTAKPAFAVSKTDVQQVFTSTTRTLSPPTTTAGSAGAGSLPWALIAGAAVAALILLLALFQLIRRRRAKGEPAPVPQSASAAAAATAAPLPPPESPPAPVERAPVAPFPEPPVAAAPAPPAVPAPPTPSADPTRGCDHFWEVAYDRGQLGGDGVWRFPHRCRTCGLQLLARDIQDANTQAGP